MKRSFSFFLYGAAIASLWLIGFNACTTPPRPIQANVSASAAPQETGASCHSAVYSTSAGSRISGLPAGTGDFRGKE